MVLKHAKCDLNGVKIAIFAAKIIQQLVALPPMWHARVATVCSARDLFVRKTFPFGSSPLSLSKTLVALLIAFTLADRFFKRLLGPHTKPANKRCRAYTGMFIFLKMNGKLQL